MSTIQAGTSTVNEKQKVHVNISVGTYDLQFDKSGDGAIGSDETLNFAAGADLTAAHALDALLGDGNYVVTHDGSDFVVEFQGDLGHSDQPELSAPSSYSFFVKTGNGANGTKFTASATASATNLNFEAKIGPFGIFVKNGVASIGVQAQAYLDSSVSDKFVIVGYGPQGLTTDFSRLSSFIKLTAAGATVDVTGAAPNCNPAFFTGNKLFCVVLPLFVGTSSTQIPIDFLSGNPGSDNALRVSGQLQLSHLFPGGDGDWFKFDTPHMPNWGSFTFDGPSLLALLSDPGMLVEGLDTILSTVQDLIGGQLFGQNLPLIGSLLSGLQNNPLVQAISSFRSGFLQPLANLIRENNLDLTSLAGEVRDLILPALGSAGLLPSLPTLSGGHYSSPFFSINLVGADKTTGATSSARRPAAASTSSPPTPCSSTSASATTGRSRPRRSI